MALRSFRRSRTVSLVIWTLIITAAVRTLLVGVFYVPSQSMMPTLLTGDYFLVTRWDYGWSRHSARLFGLLTSPRVAPGAPTRGDVVIFSSASGPRQTFVKRVMGLPGDVVEMRRGLLVLNGRPLPQRTLAEFVIPLGPNVVCLAIPGLIDLRALTADGQPGCRFLQRVETLPDGRSHRLLDFAVALTDTYGPVRVPPGHVFVIGDNRDDSRDSRVAVRDGGVGMVPMDRLLGRARYVVTSGDGTGSVLRPWTWPAAFRPERIGAIR